MERRREIGLMTGTWRKAGQQTVGLSTHMRGVGPGYRLAERGYSRLTAIGGELSRRSAWRRKKRLPVARGYSGL